MAGGLLGRHSRHIYKGIRRRIDQAQAQYSVTHMNESCHTYQWQVVSSGAIPGTFAKAYKDASTKHKRKFRKINELMKLKSSQKDAKGHNALSEAEVKVCVM